MNASDNKKLMQRIFNDLADGNDQLFIDTMADDMNWIWMGSGEWSKTFNSKSEVLGVLWSAVRETLKPPYKVMANNFIADGDYVTVEATGQNITPDGRHYKNSYCWVCRFWEGKISELKEYMDTELVTRTFTEKPIEIMNKKFLFDFGFAKATIHFEREARMNFIIIEKEGIPVHETETVEIKRTTIRPNVYLTTWKEKSNTTVTQIQDFQNGVVYSNWTAPDGLFQSREGKIITIEE